MAIDSKKMRQRQTLFDWALLVAEFAQSVRKISGSLDRRAKTSDVSLLELDLRHLRCHHLWVARVSHSSGGTSVTGAQRSSHTLTLHINIWLLSASSLGPFHALPTGPFRRAHKIRAHQRATFFITWPAHRCTNLIGITQTHFAVKVSPQLDIRTLIAQSRMKKQTNCNGCVKSICILLNLHTRNSSTMALADKLWLALIELIGFDCCTVLISIMLMCLDKSGQCALWAMRTCSEIFLGMGINIRNGT